MAHFYIPDYLNLHKHWHENLKFCNWGTDQSHTGMGKMTGDPKYVSGIWKRQQFKDLGPEGPRDQGPEGPSMKLKPQEGHYRDHRQSIFLSVGGVSERWLEAVWFCELRWYSSGMWCCRVENGMTTFLWIVECHIPQDSKFYHLDCFIYIRVCHCKQSIPDLAQYLYLFHRQSVT